MLLLPHMGGGGPPLLPLSAGFLLPHMGGGGPPPPPDSPPGLRFAHIGGGGPPAATGSVLRSSRMAGGRGLASPWLAEVSGTVVDGLFSLPLKSLAPNDFMAERELTAERGWDSEPASSRAAKSLLCPATKEVWSSWQNDRSRNRCVANSRGGEISVGRGRPLAARAPPVCVCGDAHIFPRFFRAYRKAIFGMRNFLSEWRGSGTASLAVPNGREATSPAAPRCQQGNPEWRRGCQRGCQADSTGLLGCLKPYIK